MELQVCVSKASLCDTGDRMWDFVLARQVLHQLSYKPDGGSLIPELREPAIGSYPQRPPQDDWTVGFLPQYICFWSRPYYWSCSSTIKSSLEKW